MAMAMIDEWMRLQVGHAVGQDARGERAEALAKPGFVVCTGRGGEAGEGRELVVSERWVRKAKVDENMKASVGPGTSAHSYHKSGQQRQATCE